MVFEAVFDELLVARDEAIEPIKALIKAVLASVADGPSLLKSEYYISEGRGCFCRSAKVKHSR